LGDFKTISGAIPLGVTTTSSDRLKQNAPQKMSIMKAKGRNR